MLTGLVILLGIILFIVLPIFALKRYYAPGQYSISNLPYILLGILTWPLLPVGMAYKRHDRMLLSFFWVTFLAFIVALSYWLVLHVDEFILLQEKVDAIFKV